jgi:GTP cyclohydrolase I
LQTLADTDDVAVMIDAKHYCVKARGVMDATSETQTSAFGGKFKSDSVIRQAFTA